MPTNERATKVNMLELVLFGLQIRNLANVVAISMSIFSLETNDWSV